MKKANSFCHVRNRCNTLFVSNRSSQSIGSWARLLSKKFLPSHHILVILKSNKIPFCSRMCIQFSSVAQCIWVCSRIYVFCIKSGSPALQADSLPLAPPEKSNIFCGLPRWLSGKESSSQSRRHGFDPRIWKITWRKKWQPTPVFLPVSHGQRSLTGYSPWGCRELDMTEQLNNSNNVFCSS